MVRGAPAGEVCVEDAWDEVEHAAVLSRQSDAATSREILKRRERMVYFPPWVAWRLIDTGTV